MTVILPANYLFMEIFREKGRGGTLTFFCFEQKLIVCIQFINGV